MGSEKTSWRSGPRCTVLLAKCAVPRNRCHTRGSGNARLHIQYVSLYSFRTPLYDSDTTPRLERNGDEGSNSSHLGLCPRNVPSRRQRTLKTSMASRYVSASFRRTSTARPDHAAGNESANVQTPRGRTSSTRSWRSDFLNSLNEPSDARTLRRHTRLGLDIRRSGSFLARRFPRTQLPLRSILRNMSLRRRR